MIASYSPSDLGTQVVDGAGTVLPWVGAAVAAVIAAVFVFVGIRKGIGWAVGLISDRRYAMALRDNWESHFMLARAHGWSEENAAGFASDAVDATERSVK